jgi:hypothetical protein
MVNEAIGEGHALSPDAAIREALVLCERIQTGQVDDGMEIASVASDVITLASV